VLALDPATFDLDTALAHYAEHGYARLGRVLSDEGIAALGTRVDDLMHARVTHDGLFFQHDATTGRYEDLEFGAGWRGPSPHYRKLEKLERDPLFFEWLGNPLNERIARAIYAGPIALYRAVLFTKSARGGTALPWHQDGGIFWGIDRQPTLQIWTALDDCPIDAGCVEVIPGTHKRGLATPQGGVIPDALLLAAAAETHALPLPVRAGDGLIIHNLLWHRSGINRSGQRRSALSVCLMDASTRCLRKRGAPRQFTRLFANT
jgi:phytanoyl-CoA hydroxylase